MGTWWGGMGMVVAERTLVCGLCYSKVPKTAK